MARAGCTPPSRRARRSWRSARPQDCDAEAAEAARKARLAESKRLEAEGPHAGARPARGLLRRGRGGARWRRTALIAQLRQTGTAADEDRQWFRETFQEELERAVGRWCSDNDDHIRGVCADSRPSIAKAPALVDAQLVPLEMYVLDNVAAIADKIIAAFS